jgi:hypothetical protein
MRINNFTLGFLAVGLLVFGPQALATDSLIVVGVDSASNTITVRSELCLPAVRELIVEQLFDLHSVAAVGVRSGPDLTGFVFTRLLGDNDIVTLLCIADINVNPELGGPSGPGGPNGPGGPG